MQKHVSKKVYVVGEKFKKFSSTQNVIILQPELMDFIRQTMCDNFCYEIHFGQGISSKAIPKLVQFLKNNNICHKYTLFIKQLSDKVSRTFSHKRYEDNIMITEPICIRSQTYKSFLIVDDMCSDISDHASDHLSGMVLIEAARQMTIAVTEKYFIQKNNSNLVFLTNSLTVDFLHLATPLETTIFYEIEKMKGFLNNQKFYTTISLIQNDTICAKLRYEFTIFDSKYHALITTHNESVFLKRRESLNKIE